MSIFADIVLWNGDVILRTKVIRLAEKVQIPLKLL